MHLYFSPSRSAECADCTFATALQEEEDGQEDVVNANEEDDGQEDVVNANEEEDGQEEEDGEEGFNG